MPNIGDVYQGKNKGKVIMVKEKQISVTTSGKVVMWYLCVNINTCIDYWIKESVLASQYVISQETIDKYINKMLEEA